MLDATNPFATPSHLPFGLPDYRNMTAKHIDAAITEGMKLEKEEWETIASNPEHPTVTNTLMALDRSGELLDRATGVLGTLAASVGGPELDELQEKFSPLLAAHADVYYLDSRIYERLAQLRREGPLDEESSWTVHNELQEFELAGVRLGELDKARLRELNMRIATLETTIDLKISKQLDTTGLHTKSKSRLEGLRTATLEGYADGDGWTIPCRNFSTQLEQASLSVPATRRELLETSLNRGFGGEEAVDTRADILALVRLRAERAKLLGFTDHVGLVVAGETAPDETRIKELLQRVGKSASRRVKEDVQKLSELANEDPLSDGFEAADWPYYEDLWRKQELGFDREVLSQYLELNRVLEHGVFWAAKQLFGIKMVPRPDLFGWHDDVRIWEVQEENGQVLGLFVGDFFNRPGKSGGAWMSQIQDASEHPKTLPIVSNDTNFTKPPAGSDALLSWDEVETLFHEFGHALHGLFSQTHYLGNAGTNVPRDFVELPSQLNEMWAFHPSVLSRFARHHNTGEALPEEVRTKLEGSRTFGQGFATSEYVQAAVIDQAWHTLPLSELPTDPDMVEEFERAALRDAGVFDRLVPPRYRTAYFAHTFAGGYDGAYYAYMWAEMLAAELEDWFRSVSGDTEGSLNRERGQVLRDELLSRGNSRDPLESFRAVTNVEPQASAVLRRRGLE